MIRYAWCLAAALSTVATAQELSEVDLFTVHWSRSGAFIIRARDKESSRYDPQTAVWSKASAEELVGASEVSASRLAPDGKASAEIKMTPDPREGVWSKTGAYSVSGADTFSVRLSRGDRSWELASLESARALAIFWSPDSKYALLAQDTTTTTWPGAPSDYWFSIGAAADRIQVLGPIDLVKVSQPKIIAAAAKVDALLILVGRAKKARATSIVYAAAGHETQAQAIAEAIPGGATVEALSWETNAELVVALGSSVKAVKK